MSLDIRSADAWSYRSKNKEKNKIKENTIKTTKYSIHSRGDRRDVNEPKTVVVDWNSETTSFCRNFRSIVSNLQSRWIVPILPFSSGFYLISFSVPLSFSSGTYHIREDGAGFSFYFESIYEPAIVVMVRAILYITLFMGIAIFFLESSSGSIRIDCLEEGGNEKKLGWYAEVLRSVWNSGSDLEGRVNSGRKDPTVRRSPPLSACVLCASQSQTSETLSPTHCLRFGGSKQELLDRIRHFILLLSLLLILFCCKCFFF